MTIRKVKTTTTNLPSKPIGFAPGAGWVNSTKTIFLIGCGGNGSHLLPQLARMTATNEKISIVLYDGDTVEPKNLIRQHFCSADIGKNKAEVLAARYAVLNPRISFVPEFFTKLNQKVVKSDYSLVITCTDSAKSRLTVSQQFDHIWLDLGNEKTNGQVILSNLDDFAADNYRTGFFRLPTVFELYPEYLAKAQAETQVTAPSCAELAQELPSQVGYVNLTAATLATNFLFALFSGQPIYSHQVLFSIDNVFEHRLITKERIDEWKQRIPRFTPKQ